jgi:sec-independent protein translocase protein TatC
MALRRVSRTARRERRASRVQEHMTLAEHLAELRSRIIKSLVALVICGSIVFLFYGHILDFLTEPYRHICNGGHVTCLNGGKLTITDPLEGFTVRMKVAGYGGIALALPVILWQLWQFITPGLYENERRYAAPFVFSSVVLFLMGAGIAYWTFPKALEFLINIGGDVTPMFSPNKYLSLITLMMLGFGLGFEFPILLVFLQLAGIVRPEQLAGVRRYAIVGIVVLVAVATPSGDPYSLAGLSVPMILFYEVSILIGRLVVRRRRASAAS